MSYFIANLLQFNEKENRFYVRGGSNNVVPRDNSFTHYENKEFLLLDLISGGLQLNCTNSLSKKAKEAVEKIKRNWQKQFGERNIEFGGTLSINPYSLYYISKYSTWDKEETVKNSYDLSYTSEEYKSQKLKEARAIENVWDEAILFFNEQINLFFNEIKISKN